MASKVLSVIVLCAIFFPAALPWTVDLPEVRKQHFKSGENDKSSDGSIDNSKLTENVNIELHDIYRDKYANDYDYLGYREKKMPQDGIEHGNKYLEGLRQSIDKYARTLDYCTKLNLTKESKGGDPSISTDSSQPDSDVPAIVREQCGRVTSSREHVRRLADLAVFTTKQLQDLDYEARYREVDIEREKELLMKLAFFLDELAHHTGFTPYPTPAETNEEASEAPITTTAEPALNLNFLQVPQDVRDRMIQCLRTDSSAPAPDRCAFPLPLPPILRRLFNITDSPANDTSTDPTTDQSRTQQSASSNTIARQISLTDDSSPARTIQKRSIDESPLQNVLQYYLKYHTWLNSNLQPIMNDKQTEKSDYSVPNDLKSPKSVIKRSLDKKSKHLRLEDPLLVAPRNFGSPRKLTNEEKKSQNNKIKLYLYKIRKTDGSTAKKRAQRLEKSMKSRTKRSTHYENPILPKFSQDSYQDISSYVKNKPGTIYESNLMQAAQARAGLENIFQTGNIEVVRRFGSNVNPLVPFPFLAGLLASFADM